MGAEGRGQGDRAGGAVPVGPDAFILSTLHFLNLYFPTMFMFQDLKTLNEIDVFILSRSKSMIFMKHGKT